MKLENTDNHLLHIKSLIIKKKSMTTKTFTRIATTFILSCLLAGLGVSAQDNVLKLDVFNSVWGNYGLSYERVVNKKQAFNISVNFMPEKDLFKFADDMFVIESEFKNQLSGFSISPEYRFYFGKDQRKSPRGFYMAPYVRGSQYKLLLNDTYQGHDTQVDASLFTMGLGLQLGAHWIISDVFSIDWQFLGLGVDRHSLKLDYSTKEEGVDFNGSGQSVEENNADIPFFGGKMETEYGDDYVKSTGKGFSPGLRGKLTLGIAF
jgi:hypothetical protein